MSNKSPKLKIEESVKSFLSGEIDLEYLKSSIEINGQALERISYSQIKEMDDLEYKLTMSQFFDEEDCEFDINEAIAATNKWLKNIPLDV